jgi:hypothetical protein
VTDFVTHQKVIYGVACLLPQRKSQHTGMNVELSSFTLLMLYHKVFGGKEFGKLRFDFVANGHRFVAYEGIIQKKRVVKPSCVPVWEVVSSILCLT